VRSSQVWFLVTVFFMPAMLSACEGGLDIAPEAPPSEGDAGPASVDGSAPDATLSGDASVSDATVPDARPDAEPTDPCDMIECRDDQRCDPVRLACVCPEGLLEIAGMCVELSPGDPQGRSAMEVCDTWNAGHVENASPAWRAGASACDLGTLTADGVDDGLRRVNLFRWLTGLGPVPEEPSLREQQQACAVIMDQNGRLSHNPDSSWDCHSAAGERAAGQSNIALGYRTPGAAIDGYMRDRNTPSLGHRRWILSQTLGSVSIGFAGRGQCLHVFDRSGSSSRNWTAYPNAGPVPMYLTTHEWSFHSNDWRLNSATVQMTDMATGGALAVEVSHPSNGFGPNTVSWRPAGWTPSAGDTYLVRIDGISGSGPVEYTVSPVSCD